MYKALDIKPGVYYVEFSLGDGSSLLVPLKYYKYPREDKRVGGDTRIFVVPQFVIRTLLAWGIQEGYLYVRVWAKA
jgi:hypothetical protein